MFAGLSAGAVASQFAALDCDRVRGVYLFGLEKAGYEPFQTYYFNKRGAVTHAWWNKLDPWPVVPAADAEASTLLAAVSLPSFVDANFVSLPNSLWWRIEPGTAQCKRMDAALAAPCGGSDCPQLLANDHNPKEYFYNIRGCVTLDQCQQTVAIINISDGKCKSMARDY